MIGYAKELNLMHKKNQEQIHRLNARISNRRAKILKSLGLAPNPYSRVLFDDPILLKLVITQIYIQRVANKSIKTMKFSIKANHFHENNHVLRDENFEKLIRHFAKHGIKMKVFPRDYDNSYEISLTTLELS